MTQATDIMDKDLKQARNDRWLAVFGANQDDEKNSSLYMNRKATIVIEVCAKHHS